MPESLRIGVLGDGGWGTALGITAARNGHKVTVWSPFQENVETFTEAGENSLFLPGVKVPDTVGWTTERSDIAGSDLVVIAVPSQFYRQVMDSFAGILPSDTRAVSVSKGLERNSHMRLTQIAEQVLEIPHVAALSGPSHAEEVARGIPTAVATACDDESLAREVQLALSNKCFRIYTSPDKAGVELGGALKNVIAVAVGVSDGMGFGDNTRAALITRGLTEITRLGVALGAEQQTFSGLSGMGDLIVTCTSRHSRNRALGERIGKGETLTEITSTTKSVAEGAWNSISAQQSARVHGIAVPITDEVCAMLHNGKSPAESVTDLLSRELGEE